MSFAGARLGRAGAARASSGDVHTRTSGAPEPARTRSFRSGQRVKHAKFGEGVVIESRLDRNDEEVTIAFKKAGIKRLLVSFANLKKLSG